MSRIFYLLIVSLYHTGIRIAALFSPKAKAWVAGRMNWLEKLKEWRSRHPQAPILWMHCASLGEFEQGRPVLESIRLQYPEYRIVLSFYSPSGYSQKQHYPHADYICYLPADHPRSARQWVKNLNPDLAIFVKYEFWCFHLQALFIRNIPTYLIAASFRPQQIFFRWYGGFFKRLLFQFSHLFVQTPDQLKLLQRHGITTASVAGDPRVDRVMAIAEQKTDYPAIANFNKQHKLFIAGSSWPTGEQMLLQLQHKWWTGEWKLVIAPHDISEKHIQEIIARLQIPYCRYTQIDQQTDLDNCRVMVLDTIGMLSKIYCYGDLAYIGGGFGRSIHNTLEPAAYNLPLIFGPRHEKFPEALALRQNGGAFVVSAEEDFAQIFDHLQVPSNRKLASEAVSAYLKANQGASKLIIQQLQKQKALL